jgi:hypothetical protein
VVAAVRTAPGALCPVPVRGGGACVDRRVIILIGVVAVILLALAWLT